MNTTTRINLNTLNPSLNRYSCSSFYITHYQIRANPKASRKPRFSGFYAYFYSLRMSEYGHLVY